MCSMNTRKSIFFSQTSVRIQLHDTKGVKKATEKKIEIYAGFDEAKEIDLFFRAFSPC